MSTEKKKVEQLCTTLWVYKDTRARIRKAMKPLGRGWSVDRYINMLLDMALQERKESETENEKVEP